MFRMMFLWLLVLSLFSFRLAFSDPYQVLGVSPDSSLDEIKKAYRQKALELHPDVSSLSKAEAEKAFKELQRAFETVQKAPRKSAQLLKDKESSKKTADALLETAWSEGKWSAQVSDLPRRKKAGEVSPLSVLPSRGPKEEGEWEAVSSFLKSHQKEILTSPQYVSELGQVLEKLESYFSMTGKAVQDLRSGLFEPFEIAVLKGTTSQEAFLEAFQKRGERLLRSGSFSLGESSKIYSDRFLGSQPISDLELANALLRIRLEKARLSPPTLHEAGFLLRAFSRSLSPSDQLSFLQRFKEQMKLLPQQLQRHGSYRDLESRLNQAMERTLNRYPHLKEPSPSLWQRASGFSKSCLETLRKMGN